MSKEASGIRVLNYSLSELDNGEIILRGTLDMNSLPLLKIDDYQREVLSRSGSGGRATSKLRKAITQGAIFPDVELGMRGQRFTTAGKTIVLHDPVYIVDGLQRISAMLDYVEGHSEGNPNGSIQPIGATIHFKTDKKWEKERFASLNQLRTPVSPNVMLRNMRDEHPAILTLYGLCHNDPGFALYERVCWNQRMQQRELITASMMLKTSVSLHRRIVELTATGQASGSTLRREGPITQFALAARSPGIIDRIGSFVGLQRFRDNIKEFFNIIDECWGIRSIEYGEAQGHLKGNFLMVLGAFFANNAIFWDEKGKSLRIDKATRAKLRSFPVNDPEIRRLSAGGTMVMPTLYFHLLEHMNKRKPAKDRYK